MALQLAPLRVRLRIYAQNSFWAGHEVQQSYVYQQQRGKKKLARPAKSLKVKLLEDVPKYGRRGAIVPVPPGLMRNSWYPTGMAEYMPNAQRRTSNKSDTPAERDFNFQPDKRRGTLRLEEGSNDGGIIDMQSQLLAPQRATELMSTLLPAVIDFYRAPISSPMVEKPNHDISTRPAVRSVNTAAADLAAASKPALKSEPVAIYGSVSTQDVASAIKAVLALDGEGVRVVLGPEDVTFVQTAEIEGSGDTDRVKSLGEFEVAINVKGGLTVTRTVKVHPQDSEP
ncbi:MAG: hypothetical protein M1830_006908 [Pleopsidium flavum]|nr:MAG: hypothetical protein M1830_006908 [Pleopsidium flavum]